MVLNQLLTTIPFLYCLWQSCFQTHRSSSQFKKKILVKQTILFTLQFYLSNTTNKQPKVKFQQPLLVILRASEGRLDKMFGIVDVWSPPIMARKLFRDIRVPIKGIWKTYLIFDNILELVSPMPVEKSWFISNKDLPKHTFQSQWKRQVCI